MKQMVKLEEAEDKYSVLYQEEAVRWIDAVLSHAKVIFRHLFCCCVLLLLVPGGLTVHFTFEPLINYVAFMKKEMSLFL